MWEVLARNTRYLKLKKSSLKKGRNKEFRDQKNETEKRNPVE
jgi:hypothetical protein